MMLVPVLWSSRFLALEIVAQVVDILNTVTVAWPIFQPGGFPFLERFARS